MHILTHPKSAATSQLWSYSVYGRDYEKYYFPVLKNIEIASQQGAVICLNTTPEFRNDVLRYYKKFANTIFIIEHDDAWSKTFPKVLRYLAPKIAESPVYLYKDSDSIVSEKELRIIRDWADSSAAEAIIIRDHPLHMAPILAGMFGARRSCAIEIGNSAERVFATAHRDDYDSYSYDQQWLARDIYAQIKARTLVRSSYFHYTGEELQLLERSTGADAHIGAQAYRTVAGSEAAERDYRELYGDHDLFLPFFRPLSRIYTRVRPTLFAATAFTRAARLAARLKLVLRRTPVATAPQQE